ncbi:MAG: Holliday junction resolvase RuvX [Ilumatobacteraceae bacterium]|nr:Holliday junction resolvase RuvX [Ilumatobacteraceae bacterium]
MRVLGLDLGTKRIGIAVSDRSGTIATPLLVLQRSKTKTQDHAEIRRLVLEEEAVAIVVGMPYTLRGEMGATAKAAEAECNQLTKTVGVPVYLHDERFTTVTADRTLMEARMKADARRRVVDKVAAAVMLQSWLDARPKPESP